MSSNQDPDAEISGDPRLPPELEQEIVLYAIENEINDAISLFLVCKRVREWILPVVCKVVYLYKKRLFPHRFPFYKPILFTNYGSHIQHLLISNRGSRDKTRKLLFPKLRECFLRCPNLTDLALWPKTQSFPVAIESLTLLTKLTRLSMDAPNLHMLLQGHEPGTTTTTAGLFPNITHLNLLLGLSMDIPDCQSFIRILAYQFPALTHFAHGQYLWERPIAELFQFTLRTLKNLKLFVLWRSGVYGIAVVLDEQARLGINDRRVVALVILWEKNWMEDARGTGFGLWSFAEKVLEDRENAGTTIV